MEEKKKDYLIVTLIVIIILLVILLMAVIFKKDTIQKNIPNENVPVDNKVDEEPVEETITFENFPNDREHDEVLKPVDGDEFTYDYETTYNNHKITFKINGSVGFGTLTIDNKKYEYVLTNVNDIDNTTHHSVIPVIHNSKLYIARKSGVYFKYDGEYLNTFELLYIDLNSKNLEETVLISSFDKYMPEGAAPVGPKCTSYK